MLSLEKAPFNNKHDTIIHYLFYKYIFEHLAILYKATKTTRYRNGHPHTCR